MRVTGALSPHLDPRGFKDYTLDEPTSDDNEDMFFSDSDPSNSGLTGGSAFAMDGRWGVIIRVDIRSSNYWRWLRFWRRPGGGLERGCILCSSSCVPCRDHWKEHEGLL